jgi:AraC-like DNA-binding protein
MTTVNISITDNQAKFIDKLAKDYNFDNRSELIRSFIRLFQFQPQLINEVIGFPFTLPDTNSRSKVINSFKKTGEYSPEFIKDLENGLKNSKFFSQK